MSLECNLAAAGAVILDCGAENLSLVILVGDYDGIALLVTCGLTFNINNPVECGRRVGREFYSNVALARNIGVAGLVARLPSYIGLCPVTLHIVAGYRLACREFDSIVASGLRCRLYGGLFNAVVDYLYGSRLVAAYETRYSPCEDVGTCVAETAYSGARVVFIDKGDASASRPSTSSTSGSRSRLEGVCIKTLAIAVGAGVSIVVIVGDVDGGRAVARYAAYCGGEGEVNLHRTILRDALVCSLVGIYSTVE